MLRLRIRDNGRDIDSKLLQEGGIAGHWGCGARVNALSASEVDLNTPSLIRILTVDDHPLLRKGIAALVNAEPDLKLVAEAANGKEAIEAFRSLGANDRAHAVTIGLRRGIIDLPQK